MVENRGGVVRGWEGRGSEGKGRGEEVVVRGGVVRGGEGRGGGSEKGEG